MEIIQTIIYRRSDLNKKSYDKDFKDINFGDFDNELLLKNIQFSDLILYIDDTGKTKILKNKFGNKGF